MIPTIPGVLVKLSQTLREKTNLHEKILGNLGWELNNCRQTLSPIKPLFI